MKRLSKLIIAITLILSVLVVGLTIYMNNVGNFVISIEKTERLSISLSDNNDFTNNATSILYAKGLENITHATYQNIPEDIANGDGDKNDEITKRYSAYSFYLKNTSPITVSYEMALDIKQLYKAVDGALRVLLIVDGESTIYAKRNPDGSITEHLSEDVPKKYTTVPFESETRICSNYTRVFQEGEVKKYTIVLWLEGFDVDCNDSIKGGAIRMTMQFKAS